MTGKVESLTLIEHISEGLDFCKIRIDFDEINIFGNYNELLNYVNEYVQYSVRNDMYKGKPIIVIANVANLYTVQTLDKVEDIRLVPKDADVRNVCNFDIKGLKYGDMERQCIGFLAEFELGSSNKTCWIDCTVVDERGKSFILRIFTKQVEDAVDAEAAISGMVGHYIKFNISFTKYGYQTQEIELYDTPVVLAPEVDTAVSIISNAIEGDSELTEYVTRYQFIEALQGVIDFELGYHLVRIASEIVMINMLDNISNMYSRRLLIRGSITSRGYLLPSKTKFSKPILNVTKVMRTALRTDRDLLLLLDPMADEEVSPNSNIYRQISIFANAVMEERRGITEQDDTLVKSLRNQIGNLV